MRSAEGGTWSGLAGRFASLVGPRLRAACRGTIRALGEGHSPHAAAQGPCQGQMALALLQDPGGGSSWWQEGQHRFPLVAERADGSLTWQAGRAQSVVCRQCLLPPDPTSPPSLPGRCGPGTRPGPGTWDAEGQIGGETLPDQKPRCSHEASEGAGDVPRGGSRLASWGWGLSAECGTTTQELARPAGAWRAAAAGSKGRQ